MSKSDLGNLLTKALPRGVKLTIRHVSSTPVPCVALFAAPPSESPESTFRENHFLSVSITKYHEQAASADHEIVVFGIEVLVYSTAHLTTIFVSKADSTGYLRLIDVEPRVSLLRLISTTFLSYLAETRQRPGARLVVSLFARAQNQYLFPGSVENATKHVLDDRGLIKWWCRVVDPILREHQPDSKRPSIDPSDPATVPAAGTATAYLIVPGCDRIETRGFFPATAKLDDKDRPRWVNEYPVRQICRNPYAPPRCLVPRFPDDPKARFLIDLDDELPDENSAASAAPANAAEWRSVKTLDQFWEMMAFRQECSAGRLVGFLWLVISPPGLLESASIRTVNPDVNVAKDSHGTPHVNTLSQEDEAASGQQTTQPGSSHHASLSREPPTSTNETASEPLTAEVGSPPAKVDDIMRRPTAEPNPFFWPETGRGHVVLNDADYQTAIDFLMELDFETEELATASTKTWNDKVASLADELCWGEQVVGSHVANQETTSESSQATNVLGTGQVRKRKKAEGESGQLDGASRTNSAAEPAPVTSNEAMPVNVLSSSFIRKKKKT